MAISEKATEFAGLPVVEYSPAVGLVLPTMTRREFVAEGESAWAIALEGDRLTTQTGKGKVKTKTFRSAEAAQQEYRTSIAAKVKEDYEEQEAKGETLRDALRAAVRVDPDDAASRNAYADFLSEQGEQLPACAYRVQRGDYDYEDTILDPILADPAAGLVRALVIGPWSEDTSYSPAEEVAALIAARERLPNLRAIFLGDIPYDDCEISWLVQSDLTGLFKAFPKLEQFRSRGGTGLALKKFRHERLKSLALEASNLSREVVKVVGRCDLPALEHLELWLGTAMYGADTKPADLKGIFEGKLLPSLRYLGLRNSEIADAIAAGLGKAAVMDRVKVLDLSLGTLSDKGAEALLANPRVAKLDKLDIHHHYVSEGVVARLEELGIEVDASEQESTEETDGDRYVAHAEQAVFVIVGNPGCPRVTAFQAALERVGLPPARRMPWAEVIAGRATLADCDDIVRLESPGRDWDVEKQLIAEGADVPEDGPSRVGRDEALALEFDKGRIWYPRQWYLGFRSVLRRLRLSRTTTPPADVEVLFDKDRCQERFAAAGVPVPRGLGRVRSYDELRERMREAGCRDVFVKLLHGSSASGVVAYRADGEAVTTAEMVRQGGLKLYNSRRLRHYRGPHVARLIDTLAREGVRAEEWLPRASINDQGFDLRVLVIAGKARHGVVRMSAGPFTNLHLGNQRGDPAAVAGRMGEEAWVEAMATCERAAGVFPGSLHVGVDLLVYPDWRRYAVLEANAFGDLLPGALCGGMDTYEAEARAVAEGAWGP